MNRALKRLITQSNNEGAYNKVRSFKPIQTSVLDVMGKHLSVPKYQRPYTWKIDSIELLWEDLYLDNGNSNFLGIIVLHDNGNKDDKGTRRIEIIDGQQRLTTLTLLMALIRNVSINQGFESLANITQKAIEADNAKGSQGFILKPAAKLRDFFELNVQNRESRHDYMMSVAYASLTDEQEKLVRNYRKLYELLTSHEYWHDDSKRKDLLTDIKDRLLDSELIEVTVHSEEDAYDLFETLNSRSVSLSEVNMIKNRIFMVLSSQIEEVELERVWGNIEVNAGGEKRTPEAIQKYINYFWWSRYDKIPPKKIFRKLRDESNLEFLLNEFEKDSVVYKRLKAQDSSQLVNYRHISLTEICSLASILNMQQVYIPLLSIARKLDSDLYWTEFKNRNMEPIILKLEKFIFAYKFSERSPAALERIYSENAVNIFKAPDRSRLVRALLDFEQALNDKFPTEEEFKNSFSKLKYIPGGSQNNRIISYAFSKIYFGDNPELTVNAVDLDHIFPQNPDKGFSPSEINIATRIHEIGNLTPLKDEINRNKCKNKRPKAKTIYYQESVIPENKLLAKQIDREDWTSESIHSRSTDLVNRMWEYLNS